MYPELFRIFGFPISSFGLLMVLGFLVGTWITAARMREEGLDGELATTLLLYVMGGGVAGAKLYFAVDTWWLRGEPFLDLLLAREGITWYGGFVGATLAGAIGCRLHGLSIKRFTDAIALAGPIGQSLGRVGCFLVGDDYGRVTQVPWAIAFPRGAPPAPYPVHPTQLYEIAWLLPVAWILWKRRRRSPFLFGEYMALAGLGRFLIEFWRVNPRVWLGLTEPQWIGSALVVLGAAGWLYYRRRPAAVA